MSKEVLVSVVIPVYEVEDYLARAIDSVLAQTLSSIEIILVDDGSTDDSAQICDEYTARYPDTIRVVHKQNEGLGLARNTGAALARGKYLAFIDSDDTIDPTMYASMAAAAEENGCDVVMCDVMIHYVAEDKTTVVSSYPSQTVDLCDYIANGNNITYSVNKLFLREWFSSFAYEKMLFEDIALIPAAMTHCRTLGYVAEPFYHYYRRPNTLSTTVQGALGDVVVAFKLFLERCNPVFREEAVYCAARQIYWNMMQSRVLLKADFITLLHEYEADFLKNSYIRQDKTISRLLPFCSEPVIPERFLCIHLFRPLPDDFLPALTETFPRASVVQADERILSAIPLPESVQHALDTGNISFAEEYVSLYLLYRLGGIVLTPETRAQLTLKTLRTLHVFFGFSSEDTLFTGCFGALKDHYVIRMLLDSYNTPSIVNTACLPLTNRLRDLLTVQFGLRLNGRKQLLHKEVSVLLPSVLAYDMQDGENCAKRADIKVPDGYECVSREVLAFWSARILENWNLYKSLRDTRPNTPPPKPAPPSPRGGISEAELAAHIRQVMDNYEQSTSWRITKPLRALANLFRK